jgi:hypothetical protein
MKGLPASPRHPTCFCYNQIGSIITRLCFFCPFQTVTSSTENHIGREKPYKHVPTHAASSFLRTTTPLTVVRAAGTVLDDIALGDLAPGRDAEGVSVLDRAIPDGATPGELIPGVAAYIEPSIDELAPHEVLQDEPASGELANQDERPKSEGSTLGIPLPKDSTSCEPSVERISEGPVLR